jgi:hypothetical protein
MIRGFHGLKRFDSIDVLLADPSIELAVNLTNSASH